MNDLFLLIDSHGKFSKVGYQAAVDAKKGHSSKTKDSHGPRTGKQTHSKNVRRHFVNIWNFFCIPNAFYFMVNKMRNEILQPPGPRIDF